jgi:squalene-associated FAD-dependent desaturase
MNTQPVIVVGAGWSGLAAAVKLANHGIPVTLLESSRQSGGRARRLAFADHNVDNGQHLLLGAYRHTLELVNLLGLRAETLFLRQALRLYMCAPGQEAVHLATHPGLPAPLHLLWGLWRASGLTPGERRRAVSMSLRLALNGFRLRRDISVADLLRHYRQDERLVQCLWEPLCLATLNTPIDSASAQIFLNTLKHAFAHTRPNSDALMPVQDLGSIIPEPAMQFIEQHNGHVLLGQRVLELHVENGRIAGVSTLNHTYQENDVILATPHLMTHRLIAGIAGMNAIETSLISIGTSPICTIYLQYDHDVRLPMPFIGMCGTISQWVFDRGICNQPGLLAVVISADGPHMKLGNEALTRKVIDEIATLYPGWPAPYDSKVIREKRATFASEVGVEAVRPDHETPLAGLWLAGEIVANGLPATLEGAVYNGMECARRIIEKRASN